MSRKQLKLVSLGNVQQSVAYANNPSLFYKGVEARSEAHLTIGHCWTNNSLL